MKYFLGLNNLRSIDMESPVEFRPLTILVGRNTAGKSTFLRTIPLLRQSIERKLSSPIEWNGEEKGFVDFGDFSTTVGSVNGKDSISFCFGAENLPVDDIFQDRFLKSNAERPPGEFCINQQTSFNVLLHQHNNSVDRKKVAVNIPEYGIKLDVENSADGTFKQVKINDSVLPDVISGVFEQSNGSIFAPILANIKIEGQESREMKEKSSSYFILLIRRLLENFIKLKEDIPHRFAAEVVRILENPILSKKRLEELVNSSTEEEFKNFYKDLITNHDDKFSELDGICKLYTAFTTYEKLCEVWENLIVNSTYIGPSRVRFKRFNRVDESDTSEIFFDGQNVPSFLAKLDKDLLESYSDWVKELFGFGISIERKNGHISIFTKEVDISRNLADTGFGISQLLPILTQIWWNSRNLVKYSYQSRSIVFNLPAGSHVASSPKSKLVAIEQPELHLHPAHQANLANLFGKAIADSRAREIGIEPIFLVETHSEAFISRIGYMIKRGQISPDDVQVLIFSRDVDNSPEVSDIQVSYFHEDGYLLNWPYGFFGY